MAGNTSKISIASNALILLGHKPIASLEEAGAGPQAAANLYEDSYLNLLTANRWRFATKKVLLSRLVEGPINEWKYQHQLPHDMLYLVKTSEIMDFEVYEDKLYSNYKEVSIDYIYRVDESMLPAYFTKTLEFFLAAQFAIPVTANSTRMQEYNTMYEMQLKRAKYADASQRPSDVMARSEYVDVRN